jgi:GxxExxY protein
MSRLLHQDLSEGIIAAAMKVHRALKPGLDEKLYENALIIELANRGYLAHQQKCFSVHYEGHFIGRMTPDVIVNDLVIVDPKVVESFNKDHVAKMLGYLAISGLELALLLNFKHASLQWKRIVKSGEELRGTSLSDVSISESA